MIKVFFTEIVQSFLFVVFSITLMFFSFYEFREEYLYFILKPMIEHYNLRSFLVLDFIEIFVIQIKLLTYFVGIWTLALFILQLFLFAFKSLYLSEVKKLIKIGIICLITVIILSIFYYNYFYIFLDLYLFFTVPDYYYNLDYNYDFNVPKYINLYLKLYFYLFTFLFFFILFIRVVLKSNYYYGRILSVFSQCILIGCLLPPDIILHIIVFGIFFVGLEISYLLYLLLIQINREADIV